MDTTVIMTKTNSIKNDKTTKVIRKRTKSDYTHLVQNMVAEHKKENELIESTKNITNSEQMSETHKTETPEASTKPTKSKSTRAKKIKQEQITQESTKDENFIQSEQTNLTHDDQETQHNIIENTLDNTVKQQTKYEYLTERKIIEIYHWKRDWVFKLLGEPDKIQEPNERVKAKANKPIVPMRLYAVTRIEKAQETDEFKRLQQEAEYTQLNINDESLNTQTISTTDESRNWENIIKNLPITINSFGQQKSNLNDEIPVQHALLNDAIYYFNNVYYEPQKPFISNTTSNKELINRALYLFIKFNLVDYPKDMIDEMFNNENVTKLTKMLNKRITNEIANAFPNLKGYCGKLLANY